MLDMLLYAVGIPWPVDGNWTIAQKREFVRVGWDALRFKATRKRRIAAGAGVHVQEVNRLLKEFEQMQGMMKKMKGGGLMKMMKRMGGMPGVPR